jgi:hypothetical protein
LARELRDTEDFIQKYLKELKENNAAVFVGAGFSKAAGYVDWPTLLTPIAEGLGLDAKKETPRSHKRPVKTLPTLEPQAPHSIDGDAPLLFRHSRRRAVRCG